MEAVALTEKQIRSLVEQAKSYGNAKQVPDAGLDVPEPEPGAQRYAITQNQVENLIGMAYTGQDCEAAIGACMGFPLSSGTLQ